MVNADSILIKNCNNENECEGQILTGFNDVYCNGLSSCNYTNITMPNEVYKEIIYCNGENSCESSMVSSEWGGTVECNGKGSCIDMKYDIDYQILCYGSNSCQDTEMAANSVDPPGITCAGNIYIYNIYKINDH